ncbi:MAG: phenylalanine--tRNA ligase subunit alpha, partial [candidate division WOR-3 bacterium]
MNDLYNEVIERLKSVKTLAELDSLKAEYLGRKGKVKKLLEGLKDLSPEEKRIKGKELNELRERIEKAFEDK